MVECKSAGAGNTRLIFHNNHKPAADELRVFSFYFSIHIKVIMVEVRAFLSDKGLYPAGTDLLANDGLFVNRRSFSAY